MPLKVQVGVKEGGRGGGNHPRKKLLGYSEETERKKYKLIELVREYPVLYDTAHPDHLNRAITSVLWAEIAPILEEVGK